MKTVALSHPIQAHGEWVTELSVPERITLGHLMAMDGAQGEMAKIAGLISGVCSIPLSSAQMLDLEDLEAVMAELGPLSRSGAAAGKASQATSPGFTAGPPQKRKP